MMVRHVGGFVCALIAGAALAVACANGGSSDEGIFDEGGTDVGASGSGSGASTSSGAASSSGKASSSSGSASSSGSSSGGDSGGASSGGDAGDDGSASDDGGSTGDDGGTCGSYPDTCTAGATSLGSVAGDESGATESASGYTSEWLRLDETEQDSSPVGKAMNFTAVLTSPPGMNYDLYAYLGSSVGDIECTTVKGSSTNPAGQPDQVTFSWGESGGIANGSDDSATVMIEVRWVSGACSTSQNWSLQAHGD
ncbi:MAG TPA: hypothetical protein VGG39_27855 [Polyangiaceae bacterium]|jgi:hypothetical protein